MKKLFVKALLFALLFANKLNAQLPPVYDGNIKISYVRTWNALSPQTNADTFITKSFKDVSQTTQYFDGLGRPLQTVIKQGSMITGSGAVDMVNPVVYDEFGREQYQYLPFAANNFGGNTHINDGLFKLNPFQQDSIFNKGMFPDESYYYSKTDFEASPLNRPLKLMAPGNNWVGSSRGIEAKYWFNTVADSVRVWSVTDVNSNFGNYVSDSSYPANRLYKTVAVDEHGKQVIEFTDKQGLIILKKVQLTAQPDTGTGKNHSGWLCTYYIYDDFSNLRCVIQPRGVELLAVNSWNMNYLDILGQQCFRYEYDKRNRVIMKKIPGAGAAWMVYDARDRLVLAQDSIMRSNHQWLYTQYDAINRPVATGIFTDNHNLSYHSQKADTSIAYPWPGLYTIDTLTKNFYDDYNWRNGQGNPLSASRNTTYDNHLLSASNTVWPYPQDATAQSNQAKGMVTGTKTKILGTSKYLYTVSFYDDKGRLIQEQSTNITDSTDIISTQYSWNGQPLLIIQKQKKAGTNSQTIIALTKISYDSLWRISQVDKKTSHSQVSSGHMPTDWTTILENEYDALGQVKKKTLAPGYNDGDGLDSLIYDYNIRGWMLGMNRSYVKDSSSTAHFFGIDLGYDKRNFIINGSAQNYADSLLDGNIAGMLWKNMGDNRIRKYDFAYDAANRILSADFNQLTNNSFSKAAGIDFSLYGMSYDANGNILTMNQKGLKGFASETIDSLLYTYSGISNRLRNVIDYKNDTATKLGDFRSSKAYMTALSNNKTITAADYLYDANGNITLDYNKDISYIRYNYLNLPDSFRMKGKGIISYTYDAAGNKLRKITRDSTATSVKITTTLYLGGSVFKNDTLECTAHEEGRIRKKDSTGLVYDYFIKDHLGNIRTVLTTERDTSFYPPASLEAAQLTNERLYYSKVDSGRVNKSTVAGYPNDTYTNPNDYIQKLSGSGVKVGTGIVLKVMAGDKFNIGVSSWYKANHATPGTPVNLLSDLLNALTGGAGAISAAHGGPTAGQIAGSGAPLAGITDLLNNQGVVFNGRNPKAFINWILLDEQFKCYEGNFEQVGNDQEFKVHAFNDEPVSKNGYLYIYVSNETPNIDVFFDNLQVTHMRGPICEENSYYPFGLLHKGISYRSLKNTYAENKQMFNDGTELARKEFNDGSGLELYETTFRGYDPQLGRFWQIDPLSEISHSFSPYCYANNNPVILNDPTGLEGDTAWKVLSPVVVTAKIPKGLDVANGQVYPAQSWLASAFSKPRIFTRHLPLQTEKGTLWLPVDFEVDSKGYLTNKRAKIYFVAPSVDFNSPLSTLRAVFRLKNFIKGRYLIYRALKNGKPYIGKATESLIKRYGTEEKVAEISAQVLEKLDNIPNNAIALGVEQLVIDLNGGAKSGMLSNINNATVKEIYINEARYWLSKNLPNWEQILKFQ